MNSQDYVPRSRLWLLGETLFASLLGLIPSFWAGAVSPDSVRKGLILGMLVTIPLELVRENGGIAFLKSLHYPSYDAQLAGLKDRLEAIASRPEPSAHPVIANTKPQDRSLFRREVLQLLHLLDARMGSIEANLKALEPSQLPEQVDARVRAALQEALSIIQVHQAASQSMNAEVLATQSQLMTQVTALRISIAELRTTSRRSMSKPEPEELRPGFRILDFMDEGSAQRSPGEVMKLWDEVDERQEASMAGRPTPVFSMDLLRDLTRTELSEDEKLQRLRDIGGFSLADAKEVLAIFREATNT